MTLTTEEAAKLEAHSTAIQTIVHDLLDKSPSPSNEEEDDNKDGELSGGPKTAKTPNP